MSPDVTPFSSSPTSLHPSLSSPLIRTYLNMNTHLVYALLSSTLSMSSWMQLRLVLMRLDWPRSSPPPPPPASGPLTWDVCVGGGGEEGSVCEPCERFEGQRYTVPLLVIHPGPGRSGGIRLDLAGSPPHPYHLPPHVPVGSQTRRPGLRRACGRCCCGYSTCCEEEV